MIAAFDDINFLVETTAISFFPCSHVNILLFILLLFLLLCAIDIDIIAVFYLRLLGKVDRGVWFRLILQAAKLLICEMVEFYATTVLPLTVQQFPQCLFNLV